MKDQRDCVLNDLEELGDKEFLVLTSQYKIEIFSCCLRLLPSCSSTFHQTKTESAQICSDDHLLVSRILSSPSSSRGNGPCRRRVFNLFATGYAWLHWAPGSTVLLNEQAEVGLWGFDLAFDRLAKTNTSVFNANASVFVSAVSCSLSSYSLSIKSVTVFVYKFKSNFHSIFTLQVTGCDFQHGSNFGVLESNLSGQLIFHLVAKVYSRQVTGSINCENSSVSFVMKYCPTSTVFRNPAPVQIFITRSCCESLSTRSLYFCN